MLEHITFIHSGVVTKEKIIEMMSRIDDYLRGPHWYRILVVEVDDRDMMKKGVG